MCAARGGPDACTSAAPVVRETHEPFGEATRAYHKRLPAEYDRSLCLLRRDVVDFVLATQPKEWARLKQHHSAAVNEQFLRRVATEIERRGALDVLRNGIKDSGCSTDRNLLYEVQSRLAGFPVHTDADVQAFAKVYFDGKARQDRLYAQLNPVKDRFTELEIGQDRVCGELPAKSRTSRPQVEGSRNLRRWRFLRSQRPRNGQTSARQRTRIHPHALSVTAPPRYDFRRLCLATKTLGRRP
jgi:hypothetical protein